MKTTTLIVASALAVLSLSSCHKDNSTINVNRLSSTTWCPDDDRPNDNASTKFFAQYPNPEFTFTKKGYYTLKYSNGALWHKDKQTGHWIYNSDTQELNFFPDGGSDYTVKIVKLTEEQFQFKAPTEGIDNEGKPVRGEELVSMEDDD